MFSDIPDNLISRLSEFINSKIGLYFPENRWKELRRSMSAVARDFAGKYDIADDPISCAEWLLSSPATQDQLDILAKHLTIGETYFFRDKNLFQTLRLHIFPELIGRKKTIRIWSAGCCTGEEPYSLAILIDQMIPSWPEGNITVLATDINPLFLGKAKQGIYNRWSFRDTPEWIIRKYFIRNDEKNFEICPRLKEMVTFSQLNLVADIYPCVMNNTHLMDIVFCRNVLMYFEPEQRTEIIGRFFRSLSEKGWLIFSPSETPGIRHPGLNPVQFPNVTLYRKGVRGTGFGVRGDFSEPESESSDPAPRTPHPETVYGVRGTRCGVRGENIAFISQTAAPVSESEAAHLAPRTPHPVPVYEVRGTGCGVRGEYISQTAAPVSESEAAHLAPRTPHTVPVYEEILATADLGNLDEAEKQCKAALDREKKLDPGYHYLLATIYQEQGRPKDSVKYLKNALYLDPDFVLAHFMLGNLMRLEGRSEESEKHLRNALSLLLPMKPQTVLPYTEGMTAGRLLEVIKHQL